MGGGDVEEVASPIAVLVTDRSGIETVASLLFDYDLALDEAALIRLVI